MRIQEFNPKVVSITQLRRDIEILKRVLAQKEEALVMSGQNVLFVAVSPGRYQKLKKDSSQIRAAVDRIAHIRQKYKGEKRGEVSDYVSKMREGRVKKWKK